MGSTAHGRTRTGLSFDGTSDELCGVGQRRRHARADSAASPTSLPPVPTPQPTPVPTKLMVRPRRWRGWLLVVVAACAAPAVDAGAALDAARAAAAAKKGSAKKGPSAADRARAAQARATGAKPAKADAPRATPAAKADAPRTATPIQGKRSAAGEIALQVPWDQIVLISHVLVNYYLLTHVSAQRERYIYI